MIGDIDAAQKPDAEHSAAHLSERARLEADPVTRRRSVEARRPLHRPLCQDLPLNKRRSPSDLTDETVPGSYLPYTA